MTHPNADSEGRYRPAEYLPAEYLAGGYLAGGSPFSCDAVQADLVAYLDGELDAPRETAVRAHLQACAACEAERAALDGAWRALDHLPGLTAAPGLWERMQAEILEQAEIPGQAEILGQGASSPVGSAPASPVGSAPALKGGGAGARVGATPEGRVVRFPLWAQVSGLAAAALLTAGLGFLVASGEDPVDPHLAVNSPAPRLAAAPDPIQMPRSKRPARRALPEVPDAPPIELPPRPRPGPSAGGQSPRTRPSQTQAPRRQGAEGVGEQPAQPSQAPSQPAVAQGPLPSDPLATVADPVEREVIENLELLVVLSEEPEQADAVLIENLDLLEDLEEAELDELSG